MSYLKIEKENCDCGGEKEVVYERGRAEERVIGSYCPNCRRGEPISGENYEGNDPR